MRILPCADTALLVELDGLEEVHSLYAALRANPAPGVTDIVPAARTLLIRLDPRASDPARVARFVREVRPAATAPLLEKSLRVPVIYDGADLADVAELTGLTRQEIIEAHTASEWTVAFGGFAPGFGYLTGGDLRLQVPRIAEPALGSPLVLLAFPFLTPAHRAG
jgi:allophanate hydrolase subunit 1